MRVVIDIPENDFEYICTYSQCEIYKLMCIVANGKVLPKKHGRLIDVDAFIKQAEADREHVAYMRSWTADDVFERLKKAEAVLDNGGGANADRY